jgi:hypothetical protein
MSGTKAVWRMRLFGAGVVALMLNVGLYIYAWVYLQHLQPLSLQLSAALRFFIVGSAVSLLALVLITFGYGWKRVPLALMCLISLPMWYVFTAY